MLLTGFAAVALMLTSACVKVADNNPYRAGYMYHGPQSVTSSAGPDQIRVLANGELHYR
jgi:hypothetical protein